MAQPISKKRKFVADGIFYAELNEFLMRTLSEDGYAGVEVIKLFFIFKLILIFKLTVVHDD